MGVCINSIAVKITCSQEILAVKYTAIFQNISVKIPNFKPKIPFKCPKFKKQITIHILTLKLLCFQCFDAVGWAAGRASGL